MSSKLRKIKPKKVERGSFEEQKQREEVREQNQRALLFILPLVMLAILAVGIFFGYKFYLNSLHESGIISPSEAVRIDLAADNPMFLRTVSSASKLDESFVPETAERCGILIAPEAADSLERLLTDAEQRGVDLHAVEGYISYSEQDERYQNAVQDYRKSAKSSLVMAEAHVKKTLPPAGESEQQTGLLVYFDDSADGDFADSAAYSWLMRNAVDYGFVLRYPERENTGGISFSPHLFRFVGKDYAYQMRVLDMNFDSFLMYLAAK